MPVQAGATAAFFDMLFAAKAAARGPSIGWPAGNREHSR
jgi:hypothetical protein